MPEIRTVLKSFSDLSFPKVQKLLDSPVHEDRILGLLVLVHRYQKEVEQRDDIFRFYLKNRHAINNWDLVDVTAPHIVGAHLEARPRTQLLALSKSKNLWDRRIAIVSTLWFINRGDASTTLEIAELLLKDEHDLIHKATGWMLREVGKRCAPGTLERFLDRHAAHMPRTMLRYAIEKFSEKKRRQYMESGKRDG